jgi:hypothetical protein
MVFAQKLLAPETGIDRSPPVASISIRPWSGLIDWEWFTGFSRPRVCRRYLTQDKLPSEEKLARQALDQIRGWLEKEKRARGEGFIPRLAVKFCGGCNPIIERVFLAQTIREGCTGMVHWVSGEEEPDLVLIINGCLTACADRAEIRKKAPASLVIGAHAISGIEKNPPADESP